MTSAHNVDLHIAIQSTITICIYAMIAIYNTQQCTYSGCELWRTVILHVWLQGFELDTRGWDGLFKVHANRIVHNQERPLRMS